MKVRSVTVEPGSPGSIECPVCHATVRQLKNGLPANHAEGGLATGPDAPRCEGCVKEPVVHPEPVEVNTSFLDEDGALDPDHLMLEGIDTSGGPLYTVSEMSQFFFARSSHWVRWLETCHFLVPDTEKNRAAEKARKEAVKANKEREKRGEPVKTIRTLKPKMRACPIPPASHSARLRAAHQHTWRLVFDGKLLMPLRTDSNARKYDLSLVEKFAHALAASRTIDGQQLRQALILVKVQAEMNGYIKTTAQVRAEHAQAEAERLSEWMDEQGFEPEPESDDEQHDLTPVAV